MLVADPGPLLYHSPISLGGLATYAHHQASALARCGCTVTVVASDDYAGKGPYEVHRLHPRRPVTPPYWPRLMTRAATFRLIVEQQRRFAGFARLSGVRHILMGAYFEYAAPIWSPVYKRMRDDGFVFGAMVHDPVRDYVVGPAWWHRWSVSSGYSFLREAFVHSRITLETGARDNLRTTVVPHGPYRYPSTTLPRDEIRRELQIPSTSVVLLSFGHIRDGKNLDLAIRALPDFPMAYLLVAGGPPTPGNRPLSFYQNLAECLGVGARCRWVAGYVPDAEVSNLFEAADIVLLTYNARFRSASGVLNTAASFRKLCLASSGDGDLRDAVEGYCLGQWVVPDSDDAFARGLQSLIAAAPNPQWDRYERDHSWEANARLVIDRMFAT